ncbi:vitamin K epoxide reductase family protein [Nocardioides perillae]|uniref:Putative membrane protein n=1 Tax=Nocardioides perillae TaxID=1119534 RepID=A0A7Y9RXY7_9ACTN|nr:putative membrane protein [Nocardioides perillae]
MTGGTATPDASPARLRGTGAVLVLTGAAGLVAALALTVDRFRLLADPAYEPACDLSPVLSCGSVMVTEQAAVLGFPNSLVGLVAFPVVVTVGMLLAAGVTLPRWVLGGLAAGSLLGAAFVHWLAFQSLYRIGALCPWCLVVWVAVLTACTWSVLAAARSRPRAGRLAEGLWRWRAVVLAAWLLVPAVAALERFWDYWRTLA